MVLGGRWTLQNIQFLKRLFVVEPEIHRFTSPATEKRMIFLKGGEKVSELIVFIITDKTETKTSHTLGGAGR